MCRRINSRSLAKYGVGSPYGQVTIFWYFIWSTKRITGCFVRRVKQKDVVVADPSIDKTGVLIPTGGDYGFVHFDRSLRLAYSTISNSPS